MLLGTVLLNGLGDSLTLLVVGAVVLVPRIPIEERLMSKTFPDEYARYRERLCPASSPASARSAARLSADDSPSNSTLRVVQQAFAQLTLDPRCGVHSLARLANQDAGGSSQRP
jgi:hypothetical protein